MTTRRHFIRTTCLLGTGAALSNPSAWGNTPTGQRMPDEAEPHARTWMAFGASEAIWGRKLLPEVRRNLATLANTIARYEPVSLLVRPNELALAKTLVAGNVTLVPCPLNDLWVRDTGPTFVHQANGQLGAVDFNFNGWGRKQAHEADKHVARTVAQTAGVARLSTPLVMEGGCVEVDGRGTAILTESCVLNANRNPGMSKAQFEELLMPLLGLNRIIWLPGIKGKDITDGHTDFYARFASPGVVLAGLEPDPQSYEHELTLRHLDILRSARDAQGRKLNVLTLQAPSSVRPAFETNEFAAGYIGFYVCNGAVMMQGFGDAEADQAARLTLAEAFPGRRIEQLNMDGIAAGGGSVHCATQQQPVGHAA
jgi:agmatine deiminase